MKPKCSMCTTDATKECGCGQDFCDRHFHMHNHPDSDLGAGIQ